METTGDIRLNGVLVKAGRIKYIQKFLPLSRHEKIVKEMRESGSTVEDIIKELKLPPEIVYACLPDIYEEKRKKHEDDIKRWNEQHLERTAKWENLLYKKSLEIYPGS